MTFSIGHVDGGTHAGHRKPMRDKPQRWCCNCPIRFDQEMKPGYLSRCPDCGQRRDNRFAEASVVTEQLYA